MPSRLLRASGKPPGKAGTPRRAPRRRFSPDLHPLEERTLLSGGVAPTTDEQYMLALINQARANPAAAGQSLVKLAQTDPVIGYETSGWDMNAFLRQIDSYGPLPPLAFNPRLNEAALAHDAAMVAVNAQVHSPAGFLTDPSVARASDGGAYYPTGNKSWATGENIFAYSQGVGSTPQDYVDYFEAGFLIDWGNPTFGHLKNLMAPGPAEATSGSHPPFSEIGIGLLTNANPTVPATSGMSVGPAVVTQEFGWQSGNAFLTGVVYTDANHDSAYEPGEGLGGVTIKAVGKNGQGTFQVQTWASGGYSLQLPAGTYTVTATGNVPAASSRVITIGQDNVGWDVPYQPATQQADIPVPGAYDGGGRSDMAVYRPSTGQWIIDSPVTGTRVISFGVPNLDLPEPADYDGDGKVDIAVYRPTTGQWFIQGSRRGFYAVQWGLPGDIPEPRDFDGDGKADPAVFRPSADQWWVLGSRSGVQVTHWGQAGDVPVPRDFDGDGKVDVAVYRPATGQWFVDGSRSGLVAVQWGLPGDIPVPRNYDGTGKDEIAVYRPSSAQWWILGATGVRVTQFGTPGQDIPVPANLAGDGRSDLVTYQPSTAQWGVKSTQTTFQAQFGRGGTSKPSATWLAPSLAANAPPAAEEATGRGAVVITAATPSESPTPLAEPPAEVGRLTRAWVSFRRTVHRILHAGADRLHG